MPDIAEEVREADAAPLAAPDASPYDETYYREGLGPIAYGRTNEWLGHFAGVADGIVRTAAPKTVLDVGCAFGMLVESLWDRGVQAQGIDVSTYAIAQARPDIRPYVRVGVATEPLGGPYDLITCIEVLEHVAYDEIGPAIARMTAATDVILFSSTPDDFAEPTHVSVRPPLAWIRDFADAGFAIDLRSDPTFLAPHAIIFRRAPERQSDEIQMLYARLVRERVLSHARFGAIGAARRDGEAATAAAQAETARLRGHAAEVEAQNAELRARAAHLAAEIAAQVVENQTLAAHLDAARAEARRAKETERRNAMLAERARTAEAAAESLEHALDRAVTILEDDAQATRAALLRAETAVNRVVTSPIWKFKRRLQGGS